MTEQEKINYLATELMVKKINGHSFYSPQNRLNGWDPLKNAADCMECVLKMGEVGLGEEYAEKLCESVDDLWEEEYGSYSMANLDNIYDLLTRPLKTRCEAMFEVLKEQKSD